MSLVRKLKPDRSITGALVPLSMLPIFGISTLAFGARVGIIVVIGMVWVFALYYLYVFIRTANLPNLFLCIYAFILGGMFSLNPVINNNPRVEKPEFMVAWMCTIIFFGAILIYLAVTRRLKWRGREVFELAAEKVDESGNGYTSRPRPVGKINYSPEQVRKFARFCARSLIALPYTTSQNITLAPVKMGDEYSTLLGLRGDYRDLTWVNFDMNGEVSVHISQKDYLDYRDPLAFDQLCTSLGGLFIEFLETQARGEGERIVARMDDLRISVFS